MSANVELNNRPEPDQVLVDIANYVCDYEIDSTEAYDTARNSANNSEDPRVDRPQLSYGHDRLRPSRTTIP